MKRNSGRLFCTCHWILNGQRHPSEIRSRRRRFFVDRARSGFHPIFHPLQESPMILAARWRESERRLPRLRSDQVYLSELGIRFASQRRQNRRRSITATVLLRLSNGSPL